MAAINSISLSQYSVRWETINKKTELVLYKEDAQVAHAATSFFGEPCTLQDQTTWKTTSHKVNKKQFLEFGAEFFGSYFRKLSTDKTRAFAIHTVLDNLTLRDSQPASSPIITLDKRALITMANEKGKWRGGSKKASFLASLSPYESENATDSVILGKKGLFDLFKRLGIHEYQLDNAVMRTFEAHIEHTFCTQAKNKTYLCVNKESFLKHCAVLTEDPIHLTKKIETLRKKWIQTKSVKHDILFCEKVKKRMLTDINDQISHIKDEPTLQGV